MASIPLPALAARNDAPSPLQTYTTIAQLMGAQQERQLRSQEIVGQQQQNEMQALNLQSQKALLDAQKSTDWTQPDAFDSFLSTAEKNGANAAALISLRKNNLDYQNTLSTKTKTDLENLGSANDAASGLLDAIEKETDPTARSTVMQAGAKNFMANPTYASVLQNTPTWGFLQKMAEGQVNLNDDQIDQLRNTLTWHSTQVNNAQKVAQTAGEEAGAIKTGRQIAPATPQQLTDAVNAVQTYNAVPPNMRAAFVQQMKNAPDWGTLQDVQKRADAAQESFQRSADAMANARAMRDIGLQQVVAGKLVQQDQTLSGSLANSQGIRDLLDMSKGGNQVATNAALQRFAEHEVAEGGIKRFNELEQRQLIGGVGSFAREFQNWADKGFQGEMPKATNAEINTILNNEDTIARAQHDQNVSDITSRYGTVNTMRQGGKQQPNPQIPQGWVTGWGAHGYGAYPPGTKVSTTKPQ